MSWADEIKETKTICHCGKKATMNARIDESGRMKQSVSRLKSEEMNDMPPCADPAIFEKYRT